MAYVNGIIVNDNNHIEAGSSGALFTYKAPLPTTNYTPTINTVAYWPLNGNFNDYAGSNNLTGTPALTGNFTSTTPTFDTGKFGQAASFNGSSSMLYTYTQPISFADLGSGTWTFSVWFKPNSTTDRVGIFSCGPNEYALILANNSGQMCGGWCNVAWWPNGGGWQTINWVNVIMTRNGSTCKFYANGGYVGQNTDVPTSALGTSSFFNLGASYVYTSTSTSNFPVQFNGLISEFIVENKEWTQTDVTNYYTPRA